MQIKVFDMTSVNNEATIEHINSFIRGHKVLDIDRQFYTTSDSVGHWSIFITYIDLPNNSGASFGQKREKVDYKMVLNENDFARFSRLRVIRKQLAADDAVPAYAVFTDAELAQIAQLSSIDATSVSKISGIGERRMEKYGRLLCTMFQEGQLCDE